MDSDEGKLFIGGIGWETKVETLRDHFNQYGDVSQVVIMRDKTTGRSRGFGFVVFSDPSFLDRVLHDTHNIDGRTVEAKKALSREEQHSSSRSGSHNSTRGGSDNGGNFRTKKIFVGGLPSSLTEDEFCQYFENYGHVTDVVVMYDQHTQRPRGFGFITFDTEDAVDRVLHKTFHELNGKLVEVKRALPKDAFPGSGARGGGYQGSGASGVNANSGDVGRMNGNRFMQSPISAGGYPPYSVYGAAHYAYGMANSGVGYGGYGSYGVGGYGSGNTGFGGPTGTYGMTGSLRSAWGSQAPSSYGASYGGSAYSANIGYGATAPWNASGSGNSVSASIGPSAGGTSGYGNQGYGYGHYSGTDGSYSNGYGAAGAFVVNGPNSSSSSGTGGFEHQARGSGYSGSGNNGNSGYANEGWRSEPSQASGD
uniref:RRM domain-containing protein n=1 Tax=Rhizophora mucronata TaxID=61149 RepID=A0A2P2IV56_RHIMU